MKRIEIEVWKKLPGYEDNYEVSNLGRVRSLDRIRNAGMAGPRLCKGKILKQIINSYGYPFVNIYSLQGGRWTVKVHILVLLTFVGPRPENKPHSRHLDGNKKNNSLSNLKYGTVKQNERDKIKHGTVSRTGGFRGRTHSLQSRRKMRVSHSKRIEENGWRYTWAA